MTDTELRDVLRRLRAWGFPGASSPFPDADAVLAALGIYRDEGAPASDPCPVVLPFPAEAGGPPRSLSRGLVGGVNEERRHAIDFGDKSLIGRLDNDAGQISLEATRLPAGTLVFVGFVSAGAEAARWPSARPTPFNRAFRAALECRDNHGRATALVALAARLSWSVIKETVLLEANRSARWVVNDRERDRLLRAVVAQYPRRPGEPDFACEPPLFREPPVAGGQHWGRFVMLRRGLRHALGYLSVFDPNGHDWAPYCKVVHFSAEVEVAPELLRLSFAEAHRHDPDSIDLWLDWLHRLPADSPPRAALSGFDA